MCLSASQWALLVRAWTGQTAEPSRDLSVHGRRAYAGGAGGDARSEFYYSVHGARATEGVASSQRKSLSVHGGEGPGRGAFLLKPSGTAVLLSEMAPGVITPGDSWRCAPFVLEHCWVSHSG